MLSFPILLALKSILVFKLLNVCNRTYYQWHPELALMVGVDTQVFHGIVRCGAVGALQVSVTLCHDKC